MPIFSHADFADLADIVSVGNIKNLCYLRHLRAYIVSRQAAKFAEALPPYKEDWGGS